MAEPSIQLVDGADVSKATYSVKEAAELLDMSESKLRRLIRDGEFPVKGGRGCHITVPAESVREWKGATGSNAATKLIARLMIERELCDRQMELDELDARRERLLQRIKQLERERSSGRVVWRGDV